MSKPLPANVLARLIITLITLRIVSTDRNPPPGAVEKILNNLADQVANILQTEFDERAEAVRKAIEETQEKLDAR